MQEVLSDEGSLGRVAISRFLPGSVGPGDEEVVATATSSQGGANLQEETCYSDKPDTCTCMFMRFRRKKEREASYNNEHIHVQVCIRSLLEVKS